MTANRYQQFFLLGVVAGACSMSSIAQSQTTATIYGLVDAGVEVSNHGKGSLVRLVSGGQFGNRLGFRGAEDLGDGWSAIFRLEMGFTPDDGALGQGGRVWGRDAVVGLRSASFGELALGRAQSPYYLVQFAVDAFAWAGNGGLLSLTRNATGVQQLLPLAVSARFDNSVVYASPVFGGLQLRAQVAAGEGSTAIGRGYSASARYNAGPVDLVLGGARQDGAGNANGDVTAMTVGGSYNFGAVKAYAGYTREKNSCSTCTGALARGAGVTGTGASEFRLANAGVRVPFGAFAVIAQYTRVQDRSKYVVFPGGRDASWYAIGGDYALSKRTSVYASLGSVDNQNGSNYALGTGAAQQAAGAVAAGNPRADALALGLRHSF